MRRRELCTSREREREAKGGPGTGRVIVRFERGTKTAKRGADGRRSTIKAARGQSTRRTRAS